MWQQLGNFIRSMRWQARENVLQTGIRIMLAKSRRLVQRAPIYLGQALISRRIGDRGNLTAITQQYLNQALA